MGNLGSRNITGKREAEEALRRSEEHYRLLFNNAAEAIISHDSELILTDINRIGCELIGYSREELVGKNILELGILHPDDIENAANTIRRHFDGEDTTEAECTFIRKDGAERLVTVTGASIRDPDGNLQSITNICRDVTEERRVEEALRRTQFTVDHSADSVLWVTPEGKIIFANDEACRRRGYTKEEILSLTMFDINVDFAADNDLWESCVERIQREGHFVAEFRHRTKGGEVFPVEAMLNFFELEDDWLFVANIRDITERKAAEEALRESEEGFRQFADNLPEVVFEADSLGRLVYVNSNALEAFGYTEEELYSGSVGVLDMISEEYREQAVRRMQKILSEGAQGSYEYMARRKDGSTFPAIISTLTVVKDGIAVGLRGVLTDITTQKEAEGALKRVNEELDGYAHIVSHDLKGPLTAASTAIDLIKVLRERPLTDDVLAQVNEVLDIVARSVGRATTMTEDLLVLAQAGQSSAAHEPVDISEVVRSILQEKEALLEERGVRVSVDDDLGVAGMDPTHAYQLFSNLVGNAIKYNDSDNPEIHTSSLRETEQGRLHYLVRDNGPGIPEGEMEAIFLPFHKGSNSKDTGIGLSIVDKVVRLYGGEVRAYNGGGACFEFTLPIHSSQGT